MSVFPYILGIVALAFCYDLAVKGMRLRAVGNQQDAETVQALHKTLTRLEDRIENIESIVIDRAQEQDFDRRLSS